MKPKLEIDGFPVRSPMMLQNYADIECFAEPRFNLIIHGETGTGKEFLARHYYKALKSLYPDAGEMLSINCRGLTGDLARSQLFGHMKGAFTGAYTSTKGAFEEATNGVLFLDEIGLLSIDIQELLLRSISPGEYQKVGSNKIYHTKDVTIIGATDSSISALRKPFEIRIGQKILVPSLNERPEDVPGAICYLAKQLFEEHPFLKEKIKGIIPPGNLKNNAKYIHNLIDDLCNRIKDDIVAFVLSRNWVGNFRSLNSVISSAIVKGLCSASNEKAFLKNVKEFFIVFAERETIPITNNMFDINPKIEKILNQTFTSWPEYERMQWAKVISSYGNKTFKRIDLESQFGLSKRTLQNRLKEFVNAGLLIVSGNKRDTYNVANA